MSVDTSAGPNRRVDGSIIVVSRLRRDKARDKNVATSMTYNRGSQTQIHSSLTSRMRTRTKPERQGNQRLATAMKSVVNSFVQPAWG